MHASTTVSFRTDQRFVSGIVLAITGTFLFALKSICIKFAYAAGAEPTPLLTMRMLLSFPFYAAMMTYVLRSKGYTAPSRRQTCIAILLGFLGYYLASFLDMSGLMLISAQLERLTLFTHPPMIALLAWLFLGEHINRRIVTSLVLCYLGIVLMYSQERLYSTDHQVARGVCLVASSALCYSLYVLFAKPMMQRMGSRQFTSLAMMGSTGFVMAHFLMTTPVAALWQCETTIWFYAMLLSFFCTVIPSFLVNEAILRLGATRTSVIGSAGPAVTMALAVLLLDEPTSLFHFFGMATIVAGVALVAKK